MMKRIAISGAQCTGKSSLIAALKEDKAFKAYKVRSEGVRSLKENFGFDIYSGNAEVQLAVLALQAKDSGENGILLDRTVLDSLTYALYYHERQNPRLPEPILNFLTHESTVIASRIDHFIIIQPSFNMIWDGTRVIDTDQQNDISLGMIRMLRILDIPEEKVFFIHGGSIQERVEWVKAEIFK